MCCRSATLGSDLAGRQGFEPRYRGPEPRVLPLDDLPVSVAALAAARTYNYSQSKLQRTSAATDTGTCLNTFDRQRGKSFPIVDSFGASRSPLGDSSPGCCCCCFRRWLAMPP